MAHFTLPAGQTASAVTHRTVDEIWYVLSGAGEMWRRLAQEEETVPLRAGTCLSIPRGTHFQFRAAADTAIAALAVTMPPWPGEGEALKVQGPWLQSVQE
jgi:mannose-6-phosphate isomerase-like protein (cupin superfamily)